MSQDERFRVETVTEWDKGKKGPFVCDAVGGTWPQREGVSVYLSLPSTSHYCTPSPRQGSIIQWTNISWAPTMCWACARYGGGKKRDKRWGTGLWILHENLQCQAVFGTRCISMLTWAPGAQPRVTGWGWWGEGFVWEGRRPHPQEPLPWPSQN